jgi:glycosyltransferase involved in cell wall biosynthesis
VKSVWVVNHYASDPSETASGSRHFSLSRRLAALGWRPVIIAASSEHNSTKQRLKEGESTGTTRRDGVVFRWLRTSSYTGNGRQRVVNMIQFSLALLRRRSVVGLPHPDIIIGSTVHPLAAWAASHLARRYGVPFIFEIRDLWPQTIIDMGRISQNGLVARGMRWLERLLCSRASYVITLLPLAADYLATIGVEREKVVWISNGSDVDDFVRSTPEESGTFSFGYFGSLGLANGIPTIVNAFANVVRSKPELDCRLVLLGDGPGKDGLKMLASELQISHRVEFRPSVPKTEVPLFAASMDCLVMNLLDLPIYRFGISLNKMFDYMASARPIVIASSSVNNPVRDAGGGICVPADDSQALGEAMATVLHSSDTQRAQWGEDAYLYVRDHFDYGVLGDALSDTLNLAINEWNSPALASAAERRGTGQ